jgi:uncharacterized repeat protein (TIGR01451 family)
VVVVRVRRLGSVVSPVLLRKAMVGFLATLASIALLPFGVARAANVTSDFEAPVYSLGPLGGQQGWRSPSTADEGVLSSGGVSTFGQQSWRLSNAEANEAFTGTQTYSPPVSPAAGETSTKTVFIAKFSFYDADYQRGLYVTVSPDSGEGSRMQWVSLEDTPNGIEVWQAGSPLDSNGDYTWDDYLLGVLSHGAPHTIEWRIKLNPGPDNDLVRILVDGQDAGRCFTTWENYYRQSSEQSGAPNFNKPPNINSLQFRTSVQGPPELAGGGYLFDNVSVTTGTGPSTPGCDVTIDKEADSSTVTAGGLASYRLTAHNRGHVTARNLLLCDHIPRDTTFVSANRKLRHLGRRRCVFIPSLGPGKSTSVRLTLRVNAPASPGILDNIADIGPVEPPGLPSMPPGTSVPDLPTGTVVPEGPVRAIVVKRAKALVKVLKKVVAATPPPVTG